MSSISEQVRNEVEPVYRLLYDNRGQAELAAETTAERTVEVMEANDDLEEAIGALSDEIGQRLEEIPPDLGPEERKELGEAVQEAGRNLMISVLGG